MNAIRTQLRLALAWLVLFAIFFREVAMSAVTVAWAVVNPSMRMTPAIVAVPLDLKPGWRTSVLASMVTLTPGTTLVHASDDLTTLYVHAMHAADPSKIARSIKRTFEAPILQTQPASPSQQTIDRDRIGDSA